jgi:hypothetical protein
MVEMKPDSEYNTDHLFCASSTTRNSMESTAGSSISIFIVEFEPDWNQGEEVNKFIRKKN